MSKTMFGVLPQNTALVSNYLRKQAEFVLAHCRKELQLPQVNIEFVAVSNRPSGETLSRSFMGDERLLGCFRPSEPNRIFIRADREDISRILETVSHEAYHAFENLYDVRKNLSAHDEKIISEHAASEYASDVLKRINFDDTALLAQHLAGVDFSGGKKWPTVKEERPPAIDHAAALAGLKRMTPYIKLLNCLADVNPAALRMMPLDQEMADAMGIGGNPAKRGSSCADVFTDAKKRLGIACQIYGESV